MIKRTLEISRDAAHLAVRNDQLQLKREGVIVGQLPCEDIGVVVVDHPRTTYSHHALVTLAQEGATVVLCDNSHLPCAVVLPLADHTEVVWRLAEQMAVSKPIKKRLWQQIVRQKIRAQAANLPKSLAAHKKLLGIATEVRSGDTSNAEAYAAKIYWQHWLVPSDEEQAMTEPFRRDPNGTGLNAFLNYGYAIMRAALSRAIVAAGLQPSLGLHHKSRSNLFCLADDLIEPFRPLVDATVRSMFRQGYEELNQSAKAELLDLLTLSMQMKSHQGDPIQGPLMVMFHRLVASLVRCYAGEQKNLEFPIPATSPICESQVTD